LSCRVWNRPGHDLLLMMLQPLAQESPQTTHSTLASRSNRIQTFEQLFAQLEKRKGRLGQVKDAL
jgi:hypothetical protein